MLFWNPFNHATFGGKLHDKQQLILRVDDLKQPNNIGMRLGERYRSDFMLHHLV